MKEPQSTQSTGGQDSRPWWGEHLGWLLGGLPIGLAVLRVAVAARFDPQTAGVIVSRAGPLAILSGVIFIVLPLWVLVGLYALWATLSADPRLNARTGNVVRGDVVRVGIGLAAAVAIMILPLMWLLIGAPIFVGWLILVRDSKNPEAQARSAWHVEMAQGLLLTVLLPAAVVGLLTDVMWIPSEIVTHGQDDSVGYVLGEEDGWVTLLRESDRGVSMLRSDTVTRRVVCRVRWWPSSRSLFDAMNGRPNVDYPRCPSSSASKSDAPPSPRAPAASEPTAPATPRPSPST